MELKVTAGPHEVKNCPITVVFKEGAPESGAQSLVDAQGNRTACQVFEEGGLPAIAWIESAMNAGETKTYTLETAPAESNGGVEIEDIGGGKLEVRIAGKMFTRYHYGPDWPRPFLYPFIGANDTPVTRNYPMKDVAGEDQDHPHHRSVYIAYGEVNGTDNWGEGEGHAYIRHQKFEEITSGPVFGRIKSVNSWTSNDGAKQMEDVREFTFYNVESDRITDVDVKLMASDGDVALTDTKEGGIISVRVATTMDGSKGGMIENAYGGKTEAETWGKPAHWVDYHGPVDGKTMGITIMDHPASFRYPSRWHVRDYGLFAANPFALKYYEPDKGCNGDHTIADGDSIDFKYRLFVHEGDTASAEVGERYFAFIAPPRVEII